MNNNIIQILKSMGYREMAPEKWAKPVGYSLLTFDNYKEEWQITCWCPKGCSADMSDGKHYRWSAKSINIDETDFEKLKHAFQYKENEVLRQQWNYGDFSFLTTKEIAEFEMECYDEL